jgi:hypothetical protein
MLVTRKGAPAVVAADERIRANPIVRIHGGCASEALASELPIQHGAHPRRRPATATTDGCAFGLCSRL